MLCVLTLIVSLGLNTAQVWSGVITYHALPTNGVFQIDQIDSSAFEDDVALARFWSFSGTQGSQVSIRVERLEVGYEPFLWIFSGTFSDTLEFAGGASDPFELIDAGDVGFIAFAFDGLPPAISGGFNSDVLFEFSLPDVGISTYTAIVTSFAAGADDGGDGAFGYRISANMSTTAVPEPSGLSTWGISILAWRVLSRKKLRESLPREDQK